MAEEYVSLVPTANSQKPKFVASLLAAAEPFSGIQRTLEGLIQDFDVDVAVGEQLDIIGLWVGQSRLIPEVLLIQFFGFEDNVVALPMGEEGNIAVGGRFYEEGEDFVETSILADPEYRTLIKARIVRNNAQGSTTEIISALQFLFGAPAVVDDQGQMAIGVAIGRPLTLVEQAILTGLDILPRPAGVRINWLIYYFDEYFGFEGQPNALGFGEEASFLLDGSVLLDGSQTLGGGGVVLGGGVFAEEFF